MSNHKFPYRWNLSDGYPAKGIDYHGKKVFGTFICGGGSTMGYKLAGYQHLGGVEIDPKVAGVYRQNHHPKHLFIEDIRKFNERTDLPDELYSLDLLDGSPPCSSFSTAGNRDADWGKKKKFAEGQSHQRLDDLVFEYINTIDKLKPKTFLLENVSGLVKGTARAYVKKMFERISEIGYDCQLFNLNAASMGVPQKRQRVFFIGKRKEINLPKLVMSFDEELILFGEYKSESGIKTAGKYHDLAVKSLPTENCVSDVHKRVYGTDKGFTNKILQDGLIAPTLVASGMLFRGGDGHYASNTDMSYIATFPEDYNFDGADVKWLCGMSVPPVMTAQIAHQIYLQWLSKLN